MKKYRVYGTTTVTVTKEVWAANEEEACEKAYSQLDSLTAYCGNGGIDKLIGVDGYDESVDADGMIEYNDVELIEEDPDYFECPDCEEECEKRTDSEGVEYWWCENCCCAYDEDGYEFYPEEDEEEE